MKLRATPRRWPLIRIDEVGGRGWADKDILRFRFGPASKSHLSLRERSGSQARERVPARPLPQAGEVTMAQQLWRSEATTIRLLSAIFKQPRLDVSRFAVGLADDLPALADISSESSAC